eukprot:scaffold3919_cov117-Isochrysis_galbana.AAC.2
MVVQARTKAHIYKGLLVTHRHSRKSRAIPDQSYLSRRRAANVSFWAHVGCGPRAGSGKHVNGTTSTREQARHARGRATPQIPRAQAEGGHQRSAPSRATVEGRSLHFFKNPDGFSLSPTKMGLFPPLGERDGLWGVTKFILGSARGIALFRSAPSSTKLNFSLERTPCLAWGGSRTAHFLPRRALANRPLNPPERIPSMPSSATMRAAARAGKSAVSQTSASSKIVASL